MRYRLKEKYYYNNDVFKEILDDCNDILNKSITFNYKSLYRDGDNMFDFYLPDLDLSDYENYHNNVISTFELISKELLIKYCELNNEMKMYYLSEEYNEQDMIQYKDKVEQCGITYDQITNIIIYSKIILKTFK